MDFNGDGKLDVLLQWNLDNNYIRHQVYLQQPDGSLSAVGSPIDATDQLAVVSFDGVGRIDLLGPLDDGKVHLWRQTVLFQFWDHPVIPDAAFCRLKAAPFPSVIYADFDGDGLADLLLTCQDGTAQLWTPMVNRHESFEWSLSGQWPLPAGHGPLSVIDADGDGTVDLVFVQCDPPATCSNASGIHIWHNKQRPYCSSLFPIHEHDCKPVSKLFSAKETVKFEAKDGIFLKSSNLLSDNLHFISESQNGIPITLHIGDHNNDGCPEILAIATNPNSKQSVVLLEQNNENEWTAMKLPGSFDSAQSAAFVTFDSTQPFLPSVLINYMDGLQQRISVLENTFDGDTFFIRVQGVAKKPTLQPIHQNSNEQNLTIARYGFSSNNGIACPFPGVSLKVAFTDADGSRRVHQGTLYIIT